MENQSIPPNGSTLSHTPSHTQSPHYWKTTTITLLIAFVVGVVVWIFNTQIQPAMVSNVIEQKPLTENTDLNSNNNIVVDKTSSTEMENKEYFQTTGNCTINECSINKDVIDDQDFSGLATIQGYYHKYESDNFSQPVTCDGFIITGGSNKLISSFRALISQGNGLNKLTTDNRVIMNINLDDLDKILKKRILVSSNEHSVELRLMRRIEGGRGVSTCYSPVDILSVK